MSSNMDLEFYELTFDQAITKMQTLYDNMTTEKQNFVTVSEELLEGWKGKASTKASEDLEDIKKKFNDCVKNLLILKNNMLELKKGYNAVDQSIATEIGKGFGNQLSPMGATPIAMPNNNVPGVSPKTFIGGNIPSPSPLPQPGPAPFSQSK